eukprot:TRINITY_DN7323_c0_g2_i1.p1 TRINITY_DN7323_c0_g2~~TRINITY_DN7323_c0_g2_i1.p1  ORF type:complete len:330 (+),score=51.34 TRINITY_DN7323_c0_g2_i1:87-1076(+)
MTHMEDAPERTASAVSGFASTASFGRDVSAGLDELLELAPASPVKPPQGRVRRKSEGHIGKLPDCANDNTLVQSPRRFSDPTGRLRRISEILPEQRASDAETQAEKEEYMRKMKLLSLQAGLPITEVRNFGDTMVGSSVGDSRRSSRRSSRRPSVVAVPAETEAEPSVEDPLAALIRQMGATPLNEPPKQRAASRRPSQVVLSHAAMSHLTELKRPATAQSTQSTATQAPHTSEMTPLSAPPSPPLTKTPNKGLLALLRRRQNSGHSQPKHKQQVIPGDLSWRKCKRPAIDGSSVKVGKGWQADAGAKAACILLSNTGLEVFNPSMLPG